MTETGTTPSQEATLPTEEKSPAPAEGENTEEKVTLTKEEHDQLKRDAARARTAQSEKDTLERKLKRKEKRKTAAEPEPFDSEDAAHLHRKISQELFSNSDYLKALEKVPHLKKVLLSKNPLVLLDETEFIDVDDAVEQICEYLDTEIVPVVKAETKEEEKPAETETKTEEETPSSPQPVNPNAGVTPQAKPQGDGKQEEKTGMAKIEESIMKRVKVKS